MIRYEFGTAAVALQPLAEARQVDGTLTVDYAPDDLLRAVTAVLVVLGDPRATRVDALLKGGTL